MKKIYQILYIAMAIVMLASCGSSKDVVYFQNADEISVEASRMLYDAKIMPKDQLTIFIHTTDPQASAPFNVSASAPQGVGYLVDNEGNIDFPVLGKLHVGGMTRTQCQEMIAGRLKPYLAEGENPMVTVGMSSYRVTEKMSILEAIATAGDLTIYGKRDNVLLIREKETGEKEMHRLNLTDANLINSPYYYLQQNDVVYVEPNKAKAKNASISTSTTIWLSIASTLLSMTSVIISIAK